MGKLAVITHEGSQITLSMVKWGTIRRSLLFLGKKFRFIYRFHIALFIPRYEIAIYEGSPHVVFSKKPFIIFYYPNEKIARTKLEELITLVQEGGLSGIPDFIRNGKPREQGSLLVEDMHDRMMREFK